MEKKTPTPFATFNAVQLDCSPDKATITYLPLAATVATPVASIPTDNTLYFIHLATTDVYPDHPVAAPAWSNAQQDTGGPATAKAIGPLQEVTRRLV